MKYEEIVEAIKNNWSGLTSNEPTILAIANLANQANISIESVESSLQVSHLFNGFTTEGWWLTVDKTSNIYSIIMTVNQSTDTYAGGAMYTMATSTEFPWLSQLGGIVLNSTVVVINSSDTSYSEVGIMLIKSTGIYFLCSDNITLTTDLTLSSNITAIIPE